MESARSAWAERRACRANVRAEEPRTIGASRKVTSGKPRRDTRRCAEDAVAHGTSFAHARRRSSSRRDGRPRRYHAATRSEQAGGGAGAVLAALAAAHPACRADATGRRPRFRRPPRWTQRTRPVRPTSCPPSAARPGTRGSPAAYPRARPSARPSTPPTAGTAARMPRPASRPPSMPVRRARSCGSRRATSWSTASTRSRSTRASCCAARGPAATRLRKTSETAQSPLIVVGQRWLAGGRLRRPHRRRAARARPRCRWRARRASAVGQLVAARRDHRRLLVYWGTQPGRAPGGPGRGWFTRYDRPLGQMLEIASVSGNTVSFTTPLHIAFDTAHPAQLTRYTVPYGAKHAGVEDLYVRGGQDDNITLRFALYSWVKNVESDWSIGRQHRPRQLLPLRAARQLRPRHPEARTRAAAATCSRWPRYTADSLVENNIFINGNKVMVMRASGGGNVIGYNYFDNGYIGNNPGWMETGLNASHMATPHFELFEGNQAFNIDGDDTWGGAVYNTFFRNHATGQAALVRRHRQPPRHRADVRALLLQLRRQRAGHAGPGPRALHAASPTRTSGRGRTIRSGCGGSATRPRTGTRRPTRAWSARRTGTRTSTTRRTPCTGQPGFERATAGLALPGGQARVLRQQPLALGGSRRSHQAAHSCPPGRDTMPADPWPRWRAPSRGRATVGDRMFKLLLISIVIAPVLLGMQAARTGARRRRGLVLLLALVLTYDVLYMLMLYYLRAALGGLGGTRGTTRALPRCCASLLFVAWTAERAARVRPAQLYSATGAAPSRSSARSSCPCPWSSSSPGSSSLFAIAPFCLFRRRRLPQARAGHGRGHRHQPR